MKRHWIVLLFLPLAGLAEAFGAGGLSVRPESVHLNDPEATQQLLVSGPRRDGRDQDFTRQVAYSSEDTGVAIIDEQGRVHPRGEGETVVQVQLGDESFRVPVKVSGFVRPPRVSFLHQVVPVFTKAGCNTGGCHGKAEGQNGFKLSVFGFDPMADYEALVKEARGRRISFAAPAESLLLQKGAATVPHGGGLKLEPESLWFRRLERWIREGASLESEAVGATVGIEIEPESVVLSPRGQQQIRVTAVDSSGRRVCVTGEAEYESNAAPIASVDRRGLVFARDVPGEAAILVRYMNQVAVCRVTLPQPGVEFERPPEKNFVDELVWNKLQHLGIAPSEPAPDGMFLRRVYLDTIGTLPTASEAREFLSSTDPNKRARLVDALLERNEYADYWALRWSDILKVDKDTITPQGVVAMTRWLRSQFKANRRYDEFVKAIVTARGNTTGEGPAAFFQSLKKPEVIGRSVSQLFLGVRIECAECHQHPGEKWTQRDYFAFAGFFTGIERKGLPTGGALVRPINGTNLKHPRTQEEVPAAALGADPADFSLYSDRREALAEWMVGRDNPFLANTIVNRLWAHYFGRGLVEPIDDIRGTNPATNEPLFHALADYLRESDFDLKALTRVLLNSHVYQLSSVPNETNVRDEQNFSHALYKPLQAEVLLDAISQSTEVPENFMGWPKGYRAIQVWDNRMPSYFFRIFGRPARVTVCECERGSEPSISQALHLMNSSEVGSKIAHRYGRARKLSRSKLTDAQIVEELFLTTVSRFPTEEEQTLMRRAFVELADDRRAATEDVMWTLLNTKEFVFNH